jgi:NADH-quinone oxidoreductase subunit M
MPYMQTAEFPWLTTLILLPLVGMLLVGVAGALRLPDRLVKHGATLFAFAPLGLAIYLWARFDPNAVADGQGVVQFVERVPWVQAIKVDYLLGIDGISLPLVLLTTFMTPIALAASHNITHRVKAHFALLFLLEAAMLGYFVALDFFFFFIFWEFSLVPAFFLIQVWGRDPVKRRGSALTFFVYTMAGSLAMLLLFQFFYMATRAAALLAGTGTTGTFDLITLGRLGQGLPVAEFSGSLQTIIFSYAQQLGLTATLGMNPLTYTSIAFWAIFIAFAVKLAIWPFHSWLPDTYSEAPTSTSILLAAVMSKMGAYGMLRLMLPLVPDATQFFAPLIGALALIGVVAGSFGALAHSNGDLKRMIAYTSINHMGYVGMAIAAAATAGAVSAEGRSLALTGATMQMVAHGLSTGALFLLAAAIAERAGSWQVSALGGLRQPAPLLAGAFGIALFANLGLPGLAGFVGEFFIFRGVWATLPLFALLATIGLVITALSLLKLYGQVFNGPTSPLSQQVRDLALGSREFLAALPLLVALVVLGVYPAPIMDLANKTATALAQVFTRLLT